MAGAALPVGPAGDEVAGIIAELHCPVCVGNGHPAPHAVIGVVCLFALRRDEPGGVHAVFGVFPPCRVAECVGLRGAPSVQVILIGGLTPLPLCYLFPCKEKVMLRIIAVLRLAPFAVPCAYQVMVPVILVARCKAVRRNLPGQAPISDMPIPVVLVVCDPLVRVHYVCHVFLT